MIENSTLVRLQAIGLKTLHLQALHRLPHTDGDAPPDLRRIVEIQREHVWVHDGAMAERARLWPAFAQRLADDDNAAAVGDWVLLQPDALGAHPATHWVCGRLEPTSRITRRIFDERNKVLRAPIVHNVDTTLLVMGLDHDFNLRRLDRYLTLARLAGVTAVVVLTKADLCADAKRREDAVREMLPAGADVLSLNALQADAAAAALSPWLGAGETLVVLGSSGAGKSTLTNALVGVAVQDTGAVRDGDSRGRHTTTVRTLHRTPGGACIIDTPGLRTLRLDADEQGIDAAFDNVARLAPQCRFRNCRHLEEPGCAVRAGLAAERLKSYHKLQREARRDTQTQLERQRELAGWKAIGRSVRVRMAIKRG